MKKCSFTLFFLLFCSVLAISQSSSIENPRLLWKFNSNAPVRGAVAVHNGKIYFGNSAGTVYCLDKQTGKQVWQISTGGAITSAPAIAENKVIIASRDNKIYALNISDGKVVWEYRMQMTSPHTWGWDYYDATPVIDGSTIFAGSGDHSLYALNIGDGQLIWKYKTDDKIRATPLVIENNIIVPSFDGIVYALDKYTGKLARKFGTEGVEHYGKMYGWDRTSITTKPALKDSLLVFGSRDGGLYCIDFITFKKKWRFSYGSSWVGSSPVIDGKNIFVGWSDQLVFSAIDLASGNELWQHNCHAYVYSTPVFDSQNVYVGSFNGKIYGFNKATGKVAWEYQTGSSVLSSPVLDNGVLYVGSDDGYVYAIADGNRVYKAVYLPENYKDNELLSGKEISPYLEKNGYQKLDTTQLSEFLNARIIDKNPSVVVFAHQYLPSEVAGKDAQESLLKRYMMAGGKVVWLGYFPNCWQANKDMDIVGYNKDYASSLLDIDFDVNMDFGTYFATSTNEGVEWGFPKTFNSLGNSIAASEGIVALAFNEFGRIAAFYKPFGNKKNSGFISFRSWSYLPIQQNDLKAIKAIAEYGF